MDEQRKYAILFAATILPVQKLNEIGSKPYAARESSIADAIANAELVLIEDWRTVACGEPRTAVRVTYPWPGKRRNGVPLTGALSTFEPFRTCTS